MTSGKSAGFCCSLANIVENLVRAKIARMRKKKKVKPETLFKKEIAQVKLGTKPKFRVICGSKISSLGSYK